VGLCYAGNVDQLLQLVDYLVDTRNVSDDYGHGRPLLIGVRRDMQRANIAAATGEYMRDAHQNAWFVADD
jgi:hypothetical protein